MSAYDCFEWATAAAHGKDVMVILFQAKSLPTDPKNGQYQFVYVNAKRQVLGSSDPFTFSHEGDSMSSFEYVSSSDEPSHQGGDRSHEGEEEESEIGRRVGKDPTLLRGFIDSENSLEVNEAEVRDVEKPGTKDEANIASGKADDAKCQSDETTEVDQTPISQSNMSHHETLQNVQTSQETEGEKKSGDFTAEKFDTGELTEMERESGTTPVGVEVVHSHSTTENPEMEMTALESLEPMQEAGCHLSNADQHEGNTKEKGDVESLNKEVNKVDLPVSPPDECTESLMTQSDDCDGSLGLRNEESNLLKKNIELTELNTLLVHRNGNLEHVVQEFINIAGPLDKSNAALQAMWKNENQAYSRMEALLREKISTTAELTATVELLQDKLERDKKARKALEVELTRGQEENHEMRLQLQVVQRNLMRLEKEKGDFSAELKEANVDKADLEQQLKAMQDQHNTVVRHVGKLEVRCETLNEQIHVKDKHAEILLGVSGDHSQNSSILSLSGVSDVKVMCPPSFEGPEECPLSQIDMPPDRKSKSSRRSGQPRKSASTSGRHDKQHSSSKDRRIKRRQKAEVTRAEFITSLSLTKRDPARCYACGVIFPTEATAEDRRIHFEAHYEDQEPISSDSNE